MRPRPERWRAAPGRSPWDNRSVQIARGLELRKRDVERLVVAPVPVRALRSDVVMGAAGARNRGRATGGPPTPSARESISSPTTAIRIPSGR